MNAHQAVRRLREVARRQHKAISTESTYVFWLRRYMLAIPGYPEGLTSEQKLERFLTELARHRSVSAITQNQAFNAILFFYRDVLGHPLQNVDALRATRPARLRTAPSVEHTQALLRTVRNISGYPTNLIVRLLYGCGLRVSEPLNLRIKDVDLRRRRLCIRGAKGGAPVHGGGEARVRPRDAPKAKGREDGQEKSGARSTRVSFGAPLRSSQS